MQKSRRIIRGITTLQAPQRKVLTRLTRLAYDLQELDKMLADYDALFKQLYMLPDDTERTRKFGRAAVRHVDHLLRRFLPDLHRTHLDSAVPVREIMNSAFAFTVPASWGVFERFDAYGNHIACIVREGRHLG